MGDHRAFASQQAARVARVGNWLVLNGIIRHFCSGATWAEVSGSLWAANDLLQPVRSVAQSRGLGQAVCQHYRIAHVYIWQEWVGLLISVGNLILEVICRGRPRP